MSHADQLGFFGADARANVDLLADARVLEVGSYDVNGSMRDTFPTAGAYVGVDLTEGPGVDRVAYGHEVDEPDGSYDATFSGECFEHDPHYADTLANMVRLTRPGGLVAFTCASKGRPEHGTRRTLISDSPGTQAEGSDYYRNLTADDFRQMPLSKWFSRWEFWYMPTTFDLYFAGLRAGDQEPRAQVPTDRAIEPIRALMRLPHRAVRWPLRTVLWFTGDGELYQRIVLPYWLRMVRRFG
jgi:SAM-dependent methyltransferase